MGIFKNITKTLKKAAPLIGASIGMYFGGPMGSAALGGALGGGIGSLIGGGDTEDILKSALLGGIGGYASAGGNFTTAAQQASNAMPVTRASMTAARGIDSAAPGIGGGTVKIAESAAPSISSKLFDFAKSPTGIATLGGGLALASLDEEKPTGGFSLRPDPVGKTRLGTGRIGNKLYNLDDPDERRQYFEDNRKRQGAEDIESEQERERFSKGLAFMSGGEVTGPGTGTSDSVPARLSDGEFVVTAKAVRGAGGGDRDVGAARMYDMMSQLERVA